MIMKNNIKICGMQLKQTSESLEPERLMLEKKKGLKPMT